MFKKSFILILMLLLIFNLSAEEKKQSSLDKFFKRYDKNSNREITKEEFDKKCQARWNALDANKDGSVDEKELEDNVFKLPRKLQLRNPLFKVYDKNKDGKITESEGPRRRFRKRRFQKYFQKYDNNNDGVITPEEAYSSKSKWVVKLKARIYKLFFKRIDKDKSGYHEANEIKNKELFKLLDKNGDNKVSVEEFKCVHVKKYLLKFDENGDKKISKEEFNSLHQEKFKELDIDKSNSLNRKEIIDALKKKLAKLKGQDEKKEEKEPEKKEEVKEPEKKEEKDPEKEEDKKEDVSEDELDDLLGDL